MKRLLPTLGWVLVGLALLASFGVDLLNTESSGAIDLRNRITGMRLLEQGIDPYHYKWHEGDPAEYCDPFNNPRLPVSRTTATPALLLLHLPLAALSYAPARYLWLIAQWLLLLGTGWLWLRARPVPWQRWLVALFIVGFTYTDSWRLHAERGQAYVLLSFLFAWWLTLMLDPGKCNRFAAGFLAGFLATLRPPFLLLVPFLALHRRGQLAGAAAGLLAGVALPMFFEPGCWLHYFSAMQTNAVLNQTHFFPHYAQGYPPVIEGLPTDTLASYAPIPFAEFSLPALWYGFGLAPLPDGVFLLGALLPLALWLWFRRSERMEESLAGLAAWFFLVDLFLPTYRNSYNNVLILNVVAAGLVVSRRFPWAAGPCMIAVPAGWAIYAFTPEQVWLINLPTAFYTLGATLFFVFSAGAVTEKRRVAT